MIVDVNQLKGTHIPLERQEMESLKFIKSNIPSLHVPILADTESALFLQF